MSFRTFTVGMTIDVSEEKELGTSSFLISIMTIDVFIDAMEVSPKATFPAYVLVCVSYRTWVEPTV